MTIETANVVLGEARARAHVGAAKGPHVMIAVTDSGTGMSEATCARIFEPFFTTKAIGKGTGLGLSSALSTIEQSGGSVTVESEIGKGTTFSVYLPRVDAEIAFARRSVSPAQLGGGETILLVDDDEQVRSVASSVLRRSGYDLIDACSASEALSLAAKREGRIHLLLTEVAMAQMGGSDLAQRMAATRPDVKVLYMSGSAAGVVGRGVDEELAFIKKPLTLQTLRLRVREVLDR